MTVQSFSDVRNKLLNMDSDRAALRLVIVLSVAMGLSFCLTEPDANTPSLEDPNTLAEAIAGWSGRFRWFECGEPYTEDEALIRAREYANVIIREADKEDHPIVMLASVIEQESGYDRCSVGRQARRKAGLPAHPTEAQIVRQLGDRRSRSRSNVVRFDAGVAQFMWPGGIIDELVEDSTIHDVLDMEWSVSALALALSHYREYAADAYG